MTKAPNIQRQDPACEALKQWTAGTLAPPKAMGAARLLGAVAQSTLEGAAGASLMMDVIIAGGDPADSRRPSWPDRPDSAVTVYEPRPFPVDKACGEGLHASRHQCTGSPWVSRTPCVDFVGIRYVDGGRAAEGGSGHGTGRGARRTVLQRALRDRAEALGVTSILSPAHDWLRRIDHVECEGPQALGLIAADGLNSSHSARAPSSMHPPNTPHDCGCVATSRSRHGPSSSKSTGRSTPRLYVTPVGPGEVGVALLYHQDADPFLQRDAVNILRSSWALPRTSQRELDHAARRECPRGWIPRQKRRVKSVVAV